MLRLIIEYRVKKPFETIEEVQKVSGIGLNYLKENIALHNDW